MGKKEQLHEFVKHYVLVIKTTNRFKKYNAKKPTAISSQQLNYMNIGIKNYLDEDITDDLNLTASCARFCPTASETENSEKHKNCVNPMKSNIGAKLLSIGLEELRKSTFSKLESSINPNTVAVKSSKDVDMQQNLKICLEELAQKYQLSKKCTKQNKSSENIICPITNCNRSFSKKELIEHIKLDHCVEVKRISHRLANQAQKMGIKFIPSLLQEDTLCLGMILYEFNECKQRDDLENPIEQHENLTEKHSILVLAKKCSYQNCYSENEISNENISEKSKFIVIWLASPLIKYSLFSVITVCSKNFIGTHSQIIQIRSLHTSQKPKDFLTEDTNYVQLGYSDINALTNPVDNSIMLQIALHEYR